MLRYKYTYNKLCVWRKVLPTIGRNASKEMADLRTYSRYAEVLEIVLCLLLSALRWFHERIDFYEISVCECHRLKSMSQRLLFMFPVAHTSSRESLTEVMGFPRKRTILVTLKCVSSSLRLILYHGVCDCKLSQNGTHTFHLVLSTNALTFL
jgi:hypothetical protein